MGKVNVYENEQCYGDVVARVNYNNDLDYWDGRNWRELRSDHWVNITEWV